MSSICAIWKRAGTPDAKALHPRMLAALTIYGPDRHFACSSEDGAVALGGNLMHLLPEDQFDRQPLWTPNRSACLVADVRLDNRPDLTRTLALPHPEQLADSEILLAAWTPLGRSLPRPHRRSLRLRRLDPLHPAALRRP